MSLEPPRHAAWLKSSDIMAVAIAIAVFTATLWWVDGGWSELLSGGSQSLAAVGSFTGLAAGLCAMAGLALAGRFGPLERRWGLDRMLGYHRWLGISLVALVTVHVIADTWSRASATQDSLLGALGSMLTREEWMISALVGFLLIIVVALTSWHRIKRLVAYETWYYVHLLGYLAVLAGLGHQLTSGADIAGNTLGWWWWVGLYVATAIVIIWSRMGALITSIWRGGRVVDIRQETGNVVSFTVASERLGRMRARGGQFFHVRVAERGYWWHPHPFSLSKAPTRAGLRFTVKDLGDGSAQLAGLHMGARVWLEGPYGVFTAARAKGSKLVLVAAGVGVTPILAMLHECDRSQRPIVIVRVRHKDDLPHREEIEQLVAQHNGQLHIIVGSRPVKASTDPLSGQAISALVPDMAERHVFVCGPDAFSAAVMKASKQAGAKRGHVHAERFGL